MSRVLVTGAASGLGAALTAGFRARGDEVLATDRVGPRAPAPPGTSYEPSTRHHDSYDVRGEPGAAGSEPLWPLDITSDADWAAALAEVVRRWGGLDVLVNNAGIAGGGRLDVATVEEWQRLLDVNLLGMVRGLRAFTPLLKRQRAGLVVNVASLAGLVHPAGMAAYNATKAAVVALTETVGHELAGYGVRAAVVCPSYFRSGLVDSLDGSDTAVGAVVADLVARSPFAADDIAAAVLAGLDRGEELILPDPPARSAWALKQTDRAAYDAQLRRQAARLEELT